jgi:GT2 family glycosyltransferase
MNRIFISVNYGTTDIIRNWHRSIGDLFKHDKVIIIDNFYSLEERENIKKLSKELKFVLIESENIGYGNGLNKAFKYLQEENLNLDNYIVFAGNLDILYKNLNISFVNGKNVYVPFALEIKRNRNPFLTIFQKHFLKLHLFSIKSNSLFVFKLVIVIIKLAGFIPSKIWALHGSLFIFNASILNHGNIFNENSFLYSEELEFASFVEHIANSKFIDCDVVYEHIGHVSTSSVIASLDDFYKVWKPSFNNWLLRWKD